MGEGWVTEKAFTPGVGLGNKLRILGMKMQEIKNTLTEMKNVFYAQKKTSWGKYKRASRQVRRNYPK